MSLSKSKQLDEFDESSFSELEGGDSKTLMIVQVAPVEKNVSETTCSLAFGQRVRTVELGAASRKVETNTADIEVRNLHSLPHTVNQLQGLISMPCQTPTFDRYFWYMSGTFSG